MSITKQKRPHNWGLGLIVLTFVSFVGLFTYFTKVVFIEVLDILINTPR
jgi:hypothetical protein